MDKGSYYFRAIMGFFSFYFCIQIEYSQRVRLRLYDETAESSNNIFGTIEEKERRTESFN